MIGFYKCVCGQEFDNPQVFNSHKQSCDQHIINKYGTIDVYNQLRTRNHENAGKKRSETLAKKKQVILDQWIAEQHTCEKCGQIMTVKYGSGRFCSRQCANSRERPSNVKDKISATIKETISTKNSGKVKLKECTCIVCGNTFYNRIVRKACSDNCRKVIYKNNALNNKLGGPSEVSSYGKRGKYKGIHCDSTYELAFLIYCLDHDIEIIRNEKPFNYLLNGKHRRYYPDFYLPKNDLYVEIKGRDIGPVYEKAQAVLDAGDQIKILHYPELIDCFTYVCEKYNVRHSINNSTVHTLYDK